MNTPNEQHQSLIFRVVGRPYAYRAPAGPLVILGSQERPGRDAVGGSDIVVRVPGSDQANARICRQHVAVERVGRCFFARDLSGGNTLLDGRPLRFDTLAPLRSGSQLALGGVVTLEVDIIPTLATGRDYGLLIIAGATVD